MFRGGHVAQEGWVSRDAPWLPPQDALALPQGSASCRAVLPEPGGTLSIGLVSRTWDPVGGTGRYHGGTLLVDEVPMRTGVAGGQR